MSEKISREDLLQFIHQLHCKLRGAKGIKLTGLPALNEIENIIFFRFIEERKEIKLDDNIKFSKICERYATDEKIKEDKKLPNIADRNCFKLWEEFYDINTDCIIGKYFNNEVIHKYISSSVQKLSVFTDKNRSSMSSTLQELFNMVYNKFKDIKFDSEFYDMFGAAHEEFKTNDHGNGGKHTGQHFTPMIIKRLVSEELNVKSTEIYYEPCAGTGGFIHTIDKYVREKEGEKASKKFKKNIYANECNPEITKPLMINMLLHDIPVDNIHERDSLCNENCELMKEKADVIGTNYPFGMSNTIDLNDYHDKKYWGTLVRGKNVIKNSTGQFIMHIYHSLNKDGRAGFVSDRGIINNGDDSSWEKEIRKFMIKNTNLYKIWLLPNGVFPYTNFATCVIFINKGEATKKVEIYEGKFKDAKNKTGLYIEEKPVKTFTMKELEDNGYSLKMEEKVEKIKKGWVKLGDVVELIRGKSLPKTKIIDGPYPVISGCSDINNYHNDTNCLGSEYIFMARVGSAGNILLYNDKCYLTDLAFGIKCDNKKIKRMFLYYYLKHNFNEIKKVIQTNGPPNINGDNLLNKINIPSLSLQHQQEIVDFLDIQFKLYDINLLAKQIKDMPLFNLLIDNKYDLFADALHLIYRKMELDALHLIYRKMELDALHTKMEKDKKAVFNIRVNGLDCKEYKLGDIVDIQNLKSSKIEEACENGKYPFYNCSILGHLWTDKYVYDDEVLIINKTNGSGKYKVYHNKGKFNISGGLLIFKPKQKLCGFEYLLNYINYNEIVFGSCYEGQDKKNINRNLFLDKLIPIPSLQEQEKIIKDIEKIESTQSTYVEYAKSIQSQIESINKVIENVTKLNKEIDDDNSDDNSDDNTSESEEEKVEVKPIKKVKQTKKQESNESESDSSSDNSSESSEEELKTKKIVKKNVKDIFLRLELSKDNSQPLEFSCDEKLIPKPVKKVELSDSEKPKKKHKPVKKIELSSSESDSSSDSSESKSSSEDLKPKNKLIKKTK
jgi:type I restriction-modification system DNA methylase subunit